MFVDTAKVFIKSGNGGNGCMSFHREKFKPRGGPDGGDGGAGGSVTFVGDSGMNSLVAFRYSPRLFAKDGKHGMGSNRSGKKGESLIVRIPCGTIVRNTATGETVCEITEPDRPVTVAHGARGGKGNQHFSTSRNQTPRFFQKGEPGIDFEAVLELKVIADIGLVGLPNAGKSSLITAVSRATPRIADYPFTTLNPEVGVIELADYRTIVMADIPGIIEGAASGKGLGFKFLKHVERTKVLLYVIDVSDYADTPPQTALDILFREIKSFGHGLGDKKFLVAANKIDLFPNRSLLTDVINQFNGESMRKVFPISTATREGIDKLITELDTLINNEEEIINE